MEFSFTAEEMHALASELNDFYDALREESWTAQDASESLSEGH